MTDRLLVHGADLDVDVRGIGEPVLFVQTALTADELLPIARQPVLYVGGTDSGQWFAEVKELLLSWLPQAEDVLVTGADHSLAITHPDAIALSLAAFVERHPIPREKLSA